MKSELIKVFFGENLSKALLLVVNLVLISCMSVSQYAQYTLLFSMIMLGAQLVCAATERLYIADYEHFSEFSRPALVMCLGVCAAVFSVYLYGKVSLVEGVAIAVALTLLSFYQFRRITYQQRQNFSLYLIAEILKNGCWFFAVVCLYWASVDITAVSAVGLLIIATCIGFVVMPKASAAGGCASSRVRYNDVLRVVKKNADVYLYTLIAAILPYLPVLLANHLGDQDLMATYGSAMRYQAILASFISVLNVVYLPKLAAYAGEGQAHLFLRKSYASIPLMTVTSVLVTVAVVFVIPYVDKGKYPYAPAIFVCFATCSWLSLMSVASINYLLAKHVYRPILFIMTLGLVTTLLCYWPLSDWSPMFGIALSSLLGYVMINGLLVWSAWKVAAGDIAGDKEPQR